MEAKVTEGNLELEVVAFGESFHTIDKVPEGRFDIFPHLALSLLCLKVITVVHTTMRLAQVRGQFSHLRVELNIILLLLSVHYGILEEIILLKAHSL